MLLSKELNDALNEQVIHELRNVLKYMQIASYFEDLELNNIAKYFLDQSNHEKDHADKFMSHINDRVGGAVNITSVSSPELSMENPIEIARQYLKVEQETTTSIEGIYQLAFIQNSYIDLPFLQEMLNEQVEEEDSANKFLVKIQKVNDLVIFDATFGE